MAMSFLSYLNELCICLEICLFSRFMSNVLWPRMTHLVPMPSQNACCWRGAWCNSLSSEAFPFSNEQLANRYITLLKTSKGALFQSPSDVYVRNFHYLFYTLKVKGTQPYLTLCDPTDIQSMEFSRPEYGSG